MVVVERSTNIGDRPRQEFNSIVILERTKFESGISI